MTKHEEFNRLMKLCKVETVFIASVTDSIKIKYTKLPSRNGFKEYSILQFKARPSVVVWPEHWNEIKDKIAVGDPMLFFVNYPPMTGFKQKPELKNGVMIYPPLFQWVLDDIQSVAMVDDWIKSFMETVKSCEQTKGSERNE